MDTKKNAMDYDKLILQLSQITLQELLLLYIEAKTGNQGDFDELPCRLIYAIEETDNWIKEIYADRIIKNIE
jgi:hypothetical protein